MSCHVSVSKLKVCYGLFWKSLSRFSEAAVLVQDLCSSTTAPLLHGLEQMMGHRWWGTMASSLLSSKSALNFTFLTKTFYIKLSSKSNAAFHFLLCFTFGHVLVEADDWVLLLFLTSFTFWFSCITKILLSFDWTTLHICTNVYVHAQLLVEVFNDKAGLKFCKLINIVLLPRFLFPRPRNCPVIPC